MTKTNQTRDALNDTFVTGIKGILSIVTLKKTFLFSWSAWISIIVALLFTVSALIFGVNILSLVLDIKDSMISFLPDVLGFTIGGYALMIGLIHVGMLNKITERQDKNKYSLYQEMSATFAINVILQGIGFISAYIFHYINYFDSNRSEKIKLSESLINIVNTIALVYISYWLVLSVLMIIQIIINIFGFSQLHHYFVNVDKIETEEASQKIKSNQSE